MEQRQLEKKEIILTEEFTRACADCEKEDPQYAEDVRVIATAFKRAVTHGICKEHYEDMMKGIEDDDTYDTKSIIPSE